MPDNDMIDHQIELIKINRRALTSTLLPQRATHGSLTPQGVILGIEQARHNIQDSKALLHSWDIHVADMPGVDFDLSSTITIQVDRSTYDRMRDILAQYGIDLPEVE